MSSNALIFDSRCAGRAPIESGYHAHRTGAKPRFEQAMPGELLRGRAR